MKRTMTIFVLLLGTALFFAGCNSGKVEEPVRIRVFEKEDVEVVPKIKQYDFSDAKELGTIQQIRGILPGAGEGIWYIIRIDGVEYYYAEYDGPETK